LFASAIFIFGLVIGSFLNVLIQRMPHGESIVHPASHCPKCGHSLCWYELVPLVSFCLQRGRCRYCAKKISLQYPLVELFTGLIFVFLYTHYKLTLPLILSLPLAALLITITMIDLQHQIIPDILNLAGAIAGILVLALSDISIWDGLAGAFIGGATMLLIAIVSRGGMGGGDIKMMAWMGLFLGAKMTLLALFLSFILGGLISFILIMTGLKKRKDFIPFGPFLAAGGFAAYLFGPEILAWYVQTFIR